MRMVLAVLILLAVPAGAGLPPLDIQVLSKTAFEQRSADPGQPDALNVRISNFTGTTATNVMLRATLPEGGVFVSGTTTIGQCTVSPGQPSEIVCNWPGLELERALVLGLTLTYRAPDRNDGGAYPVRFEATATANGATVSHANTITVPLRKRFVVTHGGEAGPGSLRQAMADANAACAAAPCLIAFTTAEVIRPVTPLPVVNGFVKIDGGASRVELDGSLLTQGHAIESHRPCELRVVNVRIHHFPGHAIEAAGDGTVCEPGTYFSGVDVQNSELWQNLRGVVAKDINVTITNNVIRDHRRAGLFLEAVWRAVVDGNSINGNGASGVFIDSRARPFPHLVTDARIMNNVIRNNREWGVCRTAGGKVYVSRNEIADNYAHAIDIGLDLDTPNRPDATSGVPNKPILHSAHFDPATGSTIVRGHLDPFSGWLEVYASRGVSGAGYPQAERFIATTAFNTSAEGPFELKIPGDFRGQWITATASRDYLIDIGFAYFDTSEISGAVPVH